jgi:branched-chain amino acid transport system ATP-binding protein
VSAVQPILETRDLSFRFGAAVVTDRVSLAVREGEFLSIIGPNGAGKTTFFNLLSGLLRPAGGRIIWRGRDVTGSDAATRARAGMARSFQVSGLFWQLPVLENARLAAQARSRDGGAQNRGPGWLLLPVTSYRHYRDRAERALALVGLERHADLAAVALSHGDKRKLELAMVLASDPEILLLDEPTSGVSAEDVPAMVDLIRHIREQERKTVLMVEHKMGVVRRLSDRVAVLRAGALLAIDTPDAIQQNEAVQAAYLGTEIL